MKNLNKSVTLWPDRAHELRMELARKIASFVGSAEKLVTDIPGLMLTRRTAPTAPSLSGVRAEPGRGGARAEASDPRRNHFHL